MNGESLSQAWVASRAGNSVDAMVRGRVGRWSNTRSTHTFPDEIAADAKNRPISARAAALEVSRGHHISAAP